jgi:RNA polymerase sigma-70 factor (ECF subfamily)
MPEPRLDLPEIYKTYWPKISRYLMRMVGEGEAEDLAQEVFIKVSGALPGFRGDSSLSTWLYRIATNAALDRLRSAAIRLEQSQTPLDEESDQQASCLPAHEIPLEQRFVKHEMSACISGYIARLPEIYRAVLVLSDMEELSNPEIADILGITLAAVKIRLHRARAFLREELESGCEHYWLSELSWTPA